MPQVFNVYCDESCHLDHDHKGVMVLGAIWWSLEKIVIHRQVDATDKQIDQLVCEPYGLREEEIEIVEEACRE